MLYYFHKVNYLCRYLACTNLANLCFSKRDVILAYYMFM
jgi:hypothetical protein